MIAILRNIKRYSSLLGRDILSEVIFLTCAEGHRQRLEYRRCHTISDRCDFAKNYLGVGQITDEITRFLKFAQSESPRAVCEIGTFMGGTNFLLCNALPSVTLMIGLDLFVKNRFKLGYLRRRHVRANFFNGSSYSRKTVDRVATVLNNRKLDLLFIDGDHRYCGVKQDFLLYKRFIREGGMIAFHDIIPDYRTRYGRQDAPNYAGDVPILWSRIKSCYPSFEFVQDYEQDGFGIGVIKYSSDIPLPAEL